MNDAYYIFRLSLESKVWDDFRASDVIADQFICLWMDMEDVFSISELKGWRIAGLR